MQNDLRFTLQSFRKILMKLSLRNNSDYLHVTTQFTVNKRCVNISLLKLMFTLLKLLLFSDRLTVLD